MGADAVAWPLFVVKMGLYVSALTAGGLSLHAALSVIEGVHRRSALTLAAWAAAFALICGVARLFLTNAQLAGGLSEALNVSTLAWAWAAHAPGVLALAGSLIVISATRWLPWPTLMIIGALFIAGSFALVGHTQALATPGLAPAALALHALIAAFWIAAPITLWPRAQLDDDALLARLQRFGFWALIAIPILFGLGVWLLLRLGSGFDAVLSSLYGRLLLAKLAIVTLALALGAANKFWVVEQVRRSPQQARGVLRATLTADAIIFLTALALVAWATTVTGPPSST